MRTAAWCLCAVLLTAGCGPDSYVAARDREAAQATRALAAARDDAERARAYADRGRAISDKARFSITLNRLTTLEGERLFETGLADLDRAVALAPHDVEILLARGQAAFDAAAHQARAGAKSALFAKARTDFTAVLEQDGRNERALDMRGLVSASTGDHDGAIADFTALMRLDAHAGRLRLAEEYCERGGALTKAAKFEPAIADYRAAIELGAPSDGCGCQPDGALAWLYLQRHDYDRSWETVHRAQREQHWIPPELIEELKKSSGRAG